MEFSVRFKTSPVTPEERKDQVIKLMVGAGVLGIGIVVGYWIGTQPLEAGDAK